MSEFVEQDLSGSRFERMSLRNSTFRQVYLNGASMQQVDFSGVDIRVHCFGARISGAELVDVKISGDVRNVVINEVDVAPLIEAELNRLWPDRAKMRPDDVEGFKEGWAIVRQQWDETVERARKLPEEKLHTSVDGEWSFIQTLRHLNFASAAWIERMILGRLSPWHPLDLPWDEAPGWDGIPWDHDAHPTLDEVLTVRRQRQETVSGVIDALTEAQLASTVTRDEAGWPQATNFKLKECLSIVLNEEWEHRRFAERDLAALTN